MRPDQLPVSTKDSSIQDMEVKLENAETITKELDQYKLNREVIDFLRSDTGWVRFSGFRETSKDRLIGIIEQQMNNSLEELDSLVNL